MIGMFIAVNKVVLQIPLQRKNAIFVVQFGQGYSALVQSNSCNAVHPFLLLLLYVNLRIRERPGIIRKSKILLDFKTIFSMHLCWHAWLRLILGKDREITRWSKQYVGVCSKSVYVEHKNS